MEMPNSNVDIEESSGPQLPSNTKCKHKYSAIVGEVAVTMKKLCKVSTIVYDLLIKDNRKVTDNPKPAIRISRYKKRNQWMSIHHVIVLTSSTHMQ